MYPRLQACYDVKALPKLEPKLAYKKNRLRAYKIRCEKKGERPKTSVGPEPYAPSPKPQTRNPEP